MSTMVPAQQADTFDPLRLCRYFADDSPQPMVAVEGPEHVVRYLNPAFTRLAGIPPAELLGRPFAEVVPEAAENGCRALLDRVLRTGRPGSLAEQERRHTAAYWSYAMWAILGSDDKPAGVMIQVTEATEAAAFRRQSVAMNEALMVSSVRQHELIDTVQRGERARHELEVRVFHAEKLESLGVLAAGIAHDLNNLLTPVIGFTELAKDTLPQLSPAVPMLADALTSTRLAADLVQQILAYAGKGRFVFRPIDVSELVREMADLLSTAVSNGAVLGYELARGLPPVEADATQLQQVVMNLVKNAAEAIEPGVGTITITTRLTQVDHETLWSAHLKAAVPAGVHVSLEVADTGCGMTAAVTGKIFEPFFTTKFVGRGLGLAAVQGIVHRHRGVLQVHSEHGRGSTFRLLLPCSTATAAAWIEPRRAESWRGAGTVLVIDDEGGVRDITARILERAGLTVLVAQSGEEGVPMFRENPHGIDAVVVDLTMPGMDGLETAAALWCLRQSLPVVVMSGYSVQEVTLRSVGLGIAGFVQKPFAAPDMLAAVRYALGQ